VGEAKRTYGILNIGSNVAPIIGGFLALMLSQSVHLPGLNKADAWGQTISTLVLLICFLATCALFLYRWISRRILLQGPTLVQPTEQSEEQQKRLSIRESIRYISRSKYLIALSIIVLGYNISINLTDVLWKEQLKRLFVDPNRMLEHMNMITIGIGCFATLGAFFFSFMVTRLGWTFTALLTPLIMTSMAIGFFTFLFAGDTMTSFAGALFQTTPLAMSVYCGSLQNCLSKASKYSVFDASKELAFLPLSSESKLKGKAAIDGLGSGLGKSGSSLTYQCFIILFGSVALSTPYIAIVLFIVFAAWLISTYTLGKQFQQKTSSVID
jgi:AAA family ATP:ADP antiporter